MQEFIVKSSEAGQTSIKYLNRILKAAPDSFLYKQMRKKNIVLNDKKMAGKEKLVSGDSIKIYMTDETISNFSGNSSIDISEFLDAYNKFGKPDIIYESNDFMFVNKPVGVLSQKDKPDSKSINEWLIGYLLLHKKLSEEDLRVFKPSVCNRLDRNTGGIITFGKTLFGVNVLNATLRDRSVKKFYYTLVEGKIIESKMISGFLYKNEATNKVCISDKRLNDDYKEIKTEYKPLKYYEEKDLTLLEVHLITGKTHQIRAHLASINHPVIGDIKYGSKNKALSHQFLYAVRLEFPHLTDCMELSGKIISIDVDKEIKSIMEK